MANAPTFTLEPPVGLPVGGPHGLPAGALVTGDGRVEDHLDRAVAIDREINRLTAIRARELHTHQVEAETAARRGRTSWSDLDARSILAEIAAELHLTERAADHLMCSSRSLVEQLPATLDLLESGTITYRHALVLIDETVTLDATDTSALEAKVLGLAPELTPSALRRKLKAARERLHPESIQDRHDTAKDDRGVSVEDVGEGMSVITATLPSPMAYAIFARITDAARGMDTPEDPRTMAQRRADLFVTVLLTTEGGAPFGVIPGEDDSENFVTWFRGITPEVFITVPALTLLGKSVEPGMLNGLIPIDPVTARILVGNATSFTRILTHPETGTVLSVGRERYTIPKDLRRYLLVRDLTCRFPGCYQPAARCDLDHTIEWQYFGESEHINLALLCRGHHTVKGETEWTVQQHQDGTGILTWTSPNGRIYRTHPGTQLAS